MKASAEEEAALPLPCCRPWRNTRCQARRLCRCFRNNRRRGRAPWSANGSAGGDFGNSFHCPSLLLLAANVGTAYVFIRFETGALKLPSLPKRSPQAKKAAKKSSTPTVDDILDKISHQGMQSLTAEERRILDKASEEMKRRAG